MQDKGQAWPFLDRSFVLVSMNSHIFPFPDVTSFFLNVTVTPRSTITRLSNLSSNQHLVHFGSRVPQVVHGVSSGPMKRLAASPCGEACSWPAV